MTHHRPGKHLALVLILAGACALPMAQADDAADFIAEARLFLSKGQVNAGVIQLKNALQQDPVNGEARFLLGMAYLQASNVSAAEKELRRALELNWARGDVMVPLGKVLLGQRQYERLLRDVTVAEADPDSLQSDIMALRGLAQSALEQPEQANASLAKAIELNPSSIEALLGGSQLALRDRDYARASEFTEKALELDDQRMESWLAKGHLLRVQGQLEDALAAFDQGLSLRPNNSLALIGRASALIPMGQIDRGLDDVNLVLEGQLMHPAANYLKAQALIQKQDFDGAEAALQRVLQIKPDHHASELLLGTVHYNKGNMAQAKDYLGSFVKAQPDNIPARKLLAATQMRLKQPQLAVDALMPLEGRVSVEQDPQFQALMGSAYLQLGDYERGSGHLQLAAELAPDVSAILTQLALSHLAVGETDQAIVELESAVDLGQDLIQADALLVMTHLRRRDFDKAIGVAAAMVERRPDDTGALNMLGVAYVAARNMEKARETFQRQLKLDPDLVGAELNLARLDLAGGEREAASQRFQSVLADQPKNLRAMLGMAQIAVQEQRREDSTRWLEDAWKANPSSIAAGSLLVRDYVGRGEKLKALNTARDLQYLGPEHPTALYSLALALMSNGDFNSAARNFRAVTERRPKEAEFWHSLATAEMRADNLQEARTAYDEALRLKPKLLPARVGRVELELRDKHYELALAGAQVLQEEAPQLLAGHKLAGQAYDGLGQRVAAVAAYRKAYEIKAEGPVALAMAMSQYALGEKEAAYRSLGDWLERSPTDADVRARLASLLAADGNQNAAVEHYEKVLQQRPNDVTSLNNLAWIYSMLGNSKAVEYAEKAVELAPDRAEVTDTLGWVLVQADQPQRALLFLQQAAIQAPHIPDIHYHLAVAYEKVGRREDAIEKLELLLEQDQPFADRNEAKALLYRLR